MASSDAGRRSGSTGSGTSASRPAGCVRSTPTRSTRSGALLGKRVEEQAAEEFRVEVGRLRRHGLSGRSDGANLLHRRRPQKEREVVLARPQKRLRLVEVARVAEAALVRDVVLGEAERVL